LFFRPASIAAYIYRQESFFILICVIQFSLTPDCYKILFRIIFIANVKLGEEVESGTPACCFEKLSGSIFNPGPGYKKVYYYWNEENNAQ